MEEEFERDMKPKLIGETYMKYPTENSNQKATYGLFECQYCKKEFEAQTKHIKSGNTKSCGCLNGDAHRLASHKFYQTWYSMIYRCTNDKSPAYKHYGGRGIIVCDEWLDIKKFIAWCDATHPNIKGFSLDRIDVNMGYSPENCRWADITTQNTNQRMKSINTSGYTGVSYHIRDEVWAANIGTNNKLKHIGTFKTKEEAVQARDNYITQNNLPHKLSTDYKREES